MVIHKVFGLDISDTGPVAAALGKALGLTFTQHESSYLGEYWLHEGADGAKVAVSYNEDPMYLPGDPEEEMYVHPDFRNCPVLVSLTVPLALEATFSDAVTAIHSRAAVISRDAA
ncbi:hypothetical protein [Lysobacter tyrosinilyticus]